MKTYYVIAMLQCPGFQGKLPMLYNATYKNPHQATLAKEHLEGEYPKNKYVVVPIALPVHAGDTVDLPEGEVA